MSQRARALVERLKRESSHLPGNTPAQNKAIETICQILDELAPAAEPEPEVEAEPEAEPEAATASEPAGEAEDAGTDEQAGDDAAAEDSAGEADDDPAGMTTQNSPT